jgi:hypothetical protein
MRTAGPRGASGQLTDSATQCDRASIASLRCRRRQICWSSRTTRGRAASPIVAMATTEICCVQHSATGIAALSVARPQHAAARSSFELQDQTQHSSRRNIGRHMLLSTYAALPDADQHRSALRLQIGLCEGERFADTQPGAPQDRDQRTSPIRVPAGSRLAHHEDDLLDRRRIGWVPLSFVRRGASRPMTWRRCRGSHTTGDVHESWLGQEDDLGEADHAGPPGVRVPLSPGRARTRSPHLRPGHTHTPTRTSVRVISPTIMPGEPEFGLRTLALIQPLADAFQRRQLVDAVAV